MKSEFIKYITSKKFILVFIALMILSIIQSADTFYYTKIFDFYHSDANPAYLSILSNNNNVKYSCILDWLMPIYLMLAYCDKYNIERKRGLHNVYLTKMTRKKHFFVKMGISFINPFIVVGIPVLFNLLTNISFLYGGDNFFGIKTPEQLGLSEYYPIEHPYITYLLYFLSFLVICGVLSCLCQSICIITRNNKISYVLCLALWMLYFTDYHFTVSLAMQPFVYEFLFIHSVRSFLYFCVPAIIIIIITYIISMGRKDEI